MILEIRKRRESIDLDNSEPVRLADGQEWFLPRPLMTMKPVFKDGKPVDYWKCFSYTPEIDKILEDLATVQDPVATVTLAVGLTAKLLLFNYDLADDEMDQVLFYRFGDPDSTRILRDVVDVVTGGLFKHGGMGVMDDPKPQSAGPDAASSARATAETSSI